MDFVLSRTARWQRAACVFALSKPGAPPLLCKLAFAWLPSNFPVQPVVHLVHWEFEEEKTTTQLCPRNRSSHDVPILLSSLVRHVERTEQVSACNGAGSERYLELMGINLFSLFLKTDQSL